MSRNNKFLNNHPQYHKINYESPRTIDLLNKFPYILAFALLDPSSLNYLKKLRKRHQLSLNITQTQLEEFLSDCKNQLEPNSPYLGIIEELTLFKKNKLELSKKK